MEQGVKSVDSWQGREKDIVVFSCVRSNGLGFLENENRMNVALTRAMHGLVIIGNERNLSGLANKDDYIKNYKSYEKWGYMLKVVKEEGVYVENLEEAYKHINRLGEEKEDQDEASFM